LVAWFRDRSGDWFSWLLVARDGQGELAIIGAWARSGWVVKLGILFSFVVIPALLLECFRSETIFGSDLIRRRNAFGRWYSYQYEEALNIDVFPGQLIRIRFSNGQELTVRKSTADLDRLEAILKARTPSVSWGVRPDIESSNG
jgi:hypothetical protein